MTIKDFFEGKGNFAIHCDTEEKAKKLLKEFDKAGYHWRTGERYIAYTNWERHKEKTCYSDDGCFGRVGYFKICGYTIIEFDEIEDVQEVKHGKWIYVGDPNFAHIVGFLYECSCCKRHIIVDYQFELREYPYCHCGAKMDEKDEGNV